MKQNKISLFLKDIFSFRIPVKLKDKVRFYQNRYYFVSFFFFVLIFYSFSLAFSNVDFNGELQGGSNLILFKEIIKFDNDISIDEKGEILSLFKEIDPKYLINVNEIYITKNQTYISNYCVLKNARGCFQNELRRGKVENTIKLLYTPFYPSLFKEALCHEIVHSIVRSNENFHEIVYDMGRKGVCYK